MNIWTGLLFLDGHLPDAKLARSLVGSDAEAPVGPPRTTAQQREQETLDARRAVPLWRPAPWIAIR